MNDKIIKTEPTPSDTLLGMIAEINCQFDSAKEYTLKAYKQALSEGFTPKQAKKFLYGKITIFSDRTIRKNLPEEAKDLSKRRAFAEAVPQDQINFGDISNFVTQNNPTYKLDRIKRSGARIRQSY